MLTRRRIMEDKVNPVRAFLASATIAATIAMLFCGVPVPDAWWAIAGAVSVFYFAK